VRLLPSVYRMPDKNTVSFCVIRREIKNTAAIFVANGHGLTDVSIPSHMAEAKKINSIGYVSFRNFSTSCFTY
jgi:hypothetical protein